MNEMILERLENVEGFPEIFELVKEAVRESIRRERPGLMLGISALGISPHGFIGGFYQIGTNIIVLNKSVIERVSKVKPGLYKSYAFSTLLHEYLHALGILDKYRTRALTYNICRETLGKDHLATKMAKDMKKFLPELLKDGPRPYAQFQDFEIIERFDEENISYID